MQDAMREQILDGDSDLAERVTDEGARDDLGRSVVSVSVSIDPQVKAKRRARNRRAHASRKANRN